MTELVYTFGITQAVGAAIGAGGAVLAEVFYLRAIQDGHVDEAERAHLRTIAHALRWGMLLVLISSIALVITDFAFVASLQPALTSVYWTEMVLVLVIVYASWAMSRKRISFTLGSAVAFTGWWYLALLVFGKLPALSFGGSLSVFVVSTALMMGVLSYARIFGKPRTH